MKSIATQILSLMICMELVLAPFPKYAAAETTTPDPVTSPSAYLKAVQAEAEALFDPKTGCATIDEEGNAKVVNQCLQSDIHGDPKAQGSIDCAARLKAFVPAWNKAQQIVKDYEKADKTDKSGAQCADCHGDTKVLNTDFMVPKEGLCSLKEKKQIAADYANPKKSCSWGSAFTAGTCLDGILDTFKASMVSMAKTAWGGLSAAKNYLFSAHKAPERLGTEKSLVLSGMDAETIRKAQQDGAKATAGTVEKAFDFFGSVVEFIGIDYPAYKEIFQCAKCGERTAALCKMVGVLGKDVIKNALIIWGTGKVLQGLNMVRKAAARGLVKTVTGKAFISWGERTGARIGELAVQGWKNFEKNWLMASKFVKGGGKLILKTFEVTDKVMTFPIKLAVSGGEKIAATRAGMKVRSMLFKHTPGLKTAVAEGAEVAGLNTVEHVSQQSSPLVIEASRAETPAMASAKREVGRLKHQKYGKPIDVTDIQNATETKFEVSGSAVKAETKNGPQYFNVGEKPESVKQIFPFGPESKSAIVRMEDGSLIIAENGRLANRVAKKDVGKMEALLGKEQAASDQKLLHETVENGKVNGVNMTEETATAATTKEGKTVEEASFNTGPECGNQKITIRAGRAF